MNKPLSVLSLLVASLGLAQAVSVAGKAEDNSPEAEKAAFKIMEGYEVNLFASEADGISKPIAMRWDELGRLWILTTLAYAQVEPGQKPNDKLYIVEDTDKDGKGDKFTVWADGLNMPTGFALEPLGETTAVYMSEGMDLIRLSDSNNDGKADKREVILTGFGTGDTHQNINSFTWDPAGDLWFSQGLHSLARVETPWGIVRGEEAGFWRLRLKDLKLEPYCFSSMASQNPWGIHFGRWGELFVKSNNTELGFCTPGMIVTPHYLQLMKLATVAVTPGKSMGVEWVESSHLPDLKDHLLIAGYFANDVTAFPVKEEASGFAQTPGKVLLVSSHPSFRPVEVNIGPDGAIYVADWFNPIIGHYQASLRHPDRDKVHGRIWRITAKGKALNQVPALVDADAATLLGHLASPERWVREMAKRQLITQAPALKDVKAVDAHHEYEIAGLAENLGQVDNALVEKCLASPEPKLRAYGARMIGRWEAKLNNPLALLERAMKDESPRVRLEAVVSASYLPTPDAMKLALRALDQPMDRFIDYALTQCVHAQSARWLPAVQSGALKFDSPKHLTYAVSAYGGPESTAIIRDLLAASPAEAKRDLLLVLAQVGDAGSLALALDGLPTDVDLLRALQDTFRARQVKPATDLAAKLQPALADSNMEVRQAAVRLVGFWDVKALSQPIRELAANTTTEKSLRYSAIEASAKLGGAGDWLAGVAETDADLVARRVAVEALAGINLKRAAGFSAKMLNASASVEESARLIAPYLGRKEGADVLAAALTEAPLAKDAASRASQALTQTGRGDAVLVNVLNAAMGIQSGALEYSPELVQQLATEAREHGNAANGQKVYQSPLIGCVACHKVGQVGGVLGPDLTTVGAGLPMELIVESVLWPGRQLKEGYFSVLVTTRDGKVYNGYREREEAGVLWLRDIATQQTVPIQIEQIRERQDVGTLMPAGVTASLKREELRDLLRYLADLKGR